MSRIMQCSYNVIKMATALPPFKSFEVSSDPNIGARWKKWISTFESLLVATYRPHKNLGKDQEISFKEQALNQEDGNRTGKRTASVTGVVAVIRTSVQQQIKHVTNVEKRVGAPG